MGDHDGLFKRVFGDPAHAAGELRAVLPAELVAALDLDALQLEPASFVDPELAQRHADLLFSAPRRADGARVYVYFLIEHQSEPDPLMPWRMLTYVHRIWASILRDDPERRTLPPVVPVVVHHGAAGWTVPRRMHALIDGLVDLSTLRRFVPDFELVVDDLVRVPDDELRRRPLAAFPRVALWLLRDARDPTRFAANWDAWLGTVRETLRPGLDEHITILLRYTRRVAGRASFDRFLQTLIDVSSAEESSMITAAQAYYQDGREEGRQEGRERGLREGLEQLLTLRFGALAPDVKAKLDAADSNLLRRWLPRVLAATSVDDALTEG